MFPEDRIGEQGQSIGRGIDFAVGHHGVKAGHFGKKERAKVFTFTLV